MFTELADNTAAISVKLRRNARFLKNVGFFVKGMEQRATVTDLETRKREFLVKYNEYSPHVTQPELAEILRGKVGKFDRGTM